MHLRPIRFLNFRCRPRRPLPLPQSPRRCVTPTSSPPLVVAPEGHHQSQLGLLGAFDSLVCICEACWDCGDRLWPPLHLRPLPSTLPLRYALSLSLMIVRSMCALLPFVVWDPGFLHTCVVAIVQQGPKHIGRLEFSFGRSVWVSERAVPLPHLWSVICCCGILIAGHGTTHPRNSVIVPSPSHSHLRIWSLLCVCVTQSCCGEKEGRPVCFKAKHRHLKNVRDGACQCHFTYSFLLTLVFGVDHRYAFFFASFCGCLWVLHHLFLIVPLSSPPPPYPHLISLVYVTVVHELDARHVAVLRPVREGRGVHGAPQVRSRHCFGHLMWAFSPAFPCFLSGTCLRLRPAC